MIVDRNPRRGACALFAAALFFLAAPSLDQNLTLPSVGAQMQAPSPLPGQQPTTERTPKLGLPDVVALFENQRARVVSVQTEMSAATGVPSVFEPFMGPPGGAPVIGQGSGFVVDAQGFIITNYHVVAGATVIRCIFENGESLEAQLVGADQVTDIALLRVEAGRPLTAVQFGRSNTIRTGEWVVAIGSPFGLEHTVTVGVMSATGRRIGHGPYDNFLQTDASINPGNSGGPLFNLDGEVIGVNTAIIRNGQGIGFAVPIDTVQNLLPALRDRGYVVRGFIGAGVQDLTEDLGQTFGVERGAGVLLGSVEPGAPAAQSGLETGDIVTRFAGQRVQDTPELLSAVADGRPGSQVTVEFLRDGELRSAELTIGERPDPARREILEQRKAVPSPQGTARLGVAVRPVTPQVAQQLNVEPGVGVVVERVEPGSAASRVLTRGDVIMQIGERDIATPEDLTRALREHPEEMPLRLLVHRQGRTTFVAVRMR
ncbi:MAG: trypsin-like peptidase domain-containing protein [Bradymonadaceae bacterium]|nr:trypsin-like peptidase domain-containing protein [Lujinxingiaceae bacterium]